MLWTYFNQAAAEAPDDLTVHKDLGVAHVQLSAFDEAIADFQAGLALDPNDPQLHYDLGLAYKFKDRVDEAVAELQPRRANSTPPCTIRPTRWASSTCRSASWTRPPWS